MLLNSQNENKKIKWWRKTQNMVKIEMTEHDGKSLMNLMQIFWIRITFFLLLNRKILSPSTFKWNSGHLEIKYGQLIENTQIYAIQESLHILSQLIRFNDHCVLQQCT